jgi:predicted amidophosphoribosyltransferase
MATYCANCHDNLFKYRCKQCRKPVCEDCAFKTEHGTFCSHRCAARYRDFMSKETADKGKAEGSSVIGKLFMLLLAGLAVVAVAWWKGWLPAGVESMISDLLSRLM